MIFEDDISSSEFTNQKVVSGKAKNTEEGKKLFVSSITYYVIVDISNSGLESE